MATHTTRRPRRRLRTRKLVIAIAAALAVIVAAFLVAEALGGAIVSAAGPHPHTAVQKCTAAMQVMVNDGLIGPNGLTGGSAATIRADGTPAQVAALNAAMKACDSLTAAQAKQAAAGLSP
jgi:hypothetical protein